jgi:putative DNA primase/helicase
MTGAPDDYFPWIFVVDKSDKAPHLARGAWSLEKNRKTLDQAMNLLYRDFNLGIAGMDDHLIIVDIDNEDAIDVETLVPTLSVRSRSRTGTHRFYYIDNIKDKKNIAVPDVGELRGQHQYVVCAGSYATTDPDTVPEDQREFAGQYTIEDAVPPAHITFNDLPVIFRRYYNVNYLIPLIKEKMAAMSRIFDPPIENGDRKSKSVLFDLEVTDIVHVPTNGSNFASPLHGSKNGKNSTYSDGWLKINIRVLVDQASI